MKIVQVCPYAMSRPGGVQRHVRDLSRWLNNEGHETRIVAPPAPGRSPEHADELGRTRSVSVHGTAFELSLAGPGQVRALARDLREWGAELVHLHTPWTPLVAWQIWRSLALPTVTTLHATLPGNDGQGIIDRYIRAAARYFVARSKATIIPSEAPLALLRNLARQRPITVLPPGVDLSAWRSAYRERSADRPIELVCLGRLEDRKGIAVLLEAWERLGRRRSGLRLTIAGDGAERARVLAAVAADGTGSLRYAGRPDDQEAQRLIGSADMFLAPAPYGESFGIVLVEAMSAGAVPVAAANAGYASVLTGRGKELLVPAGDSAALADRIATLAEDPKLRHSLRNWGLGHARQFDIRQIGPSYLGVFVAALSG